MEILWEELSFGMPDLKQLLRIVIRLTVATLLGAIIGLQRERVRKAAGLRTHMLVSLGCAVFVLACSQVGMSTDGISRVIQGIVTGLGFIGAGTILKLREEHHIEGVTTAASVWMTTAIGVSVGLGSMGIAILSTVFAFIVLCLAGPLEGRSPKHQDPADKTKTD